MNYAAAFDDMFRAQEEDCEAACRGTAAQHGASEYEADHCDNGSVGCPNCPFAPAEVTIRDTRWSDGEYPLTFRRFVDPHDPTARHYPE